MSIIQTMIQFSGPVELQAAASGKDKPRRLRIKAYDGAPMDCPGWGRILLDTSGVDTSKPTTLLDNHRTDLNAVLGTGHSSVKGGQIFVDAVLANTEAAANVIELLQLGVALQASVGLRVIESSELASGSSIQVNGRTIEVDRFTTFVRSGVLEEVSVTAVGACPNTEVALAARRAAVSIEGESMPNNNNVDLIQAERDRIAELDSILGDWPAERGEAIKAGWSVERAQARALHLLRAARPTLPAIHTSGGTMPSDVANSDILAAGLLIHAGKATVAEKHVGARACNAAAGLRCRSLIDWCAAGLRLSGRDVPADRGELIQAGLSTIDMRTALGSSASKVALAAYSESPQTWKIFSRIIPVRDFKEANLIRAVFGKGFQPLAPGGELRSGTLGEETSSVRAQTEGMLLQFDRVDVVNDDLQLLSDTAAALGRAGARAVSDAVYKCLLANKDSAGNDFFATANNNLVEDVLDVDGISALITAMRVMVDADGRSLDLVPKSLLVCPQDEAKARQILKSVELLKDAVTGSSLGVGTANPIENISLGVEPRLSNPQFTGSSETAFYMFSANSDGGIVVAFLDGREAPIVEEVDSGPNVLGLSFRGYHDFGVTLADPRCCIKSSGEGSEE